MLSSQYLLQQQPLYGIDKRGVVGLLTLMEHVAEGNYTVSILTTFRKV